MKVSLLMVLAWVAACAAAPAPPESEAATATGGSPSASAEVAAPVVEPARDGARCTADDACASGACDLAARVCKASKDAPCDAAIGCAHGQVCAAACATAEAACERRSCQDVVRDVVCATAKDCKHGAFCDDDHLCKWLPGARCDWSIAWCAEGQICCPDGKGSKCMPPDACRE